MTPRIKFDKQRMSSSNYPLLSSAAVLSMVNSMLPVWSVRQIINCEAAHELGKFLPFWPAFISIFIQTIFRFDPTPRDSPLFYWYWADKIYCLIRRCRVQTFYWVDLGLLGLDLWLKQHWILHCFCRNWYWKLVLIRWLRSTQSHKQGIPLQPLTYQLYLWWMYLFKWATEYITNQSI